MFEKYKQMAESMNKKVTNPQYYFCFLEGDIDGFVSIFIIPKLFYDKNKYIRDYQNLENDKDFNDELIDDIYDDEFLSLIESIEMDEEGDWDYSCYKKDVDKVFKKLMKTNLCIYKEIVWNNEV